MARLDQLSVNDVIKHKETRLVKGRAVTSLEHNQTVALALKVLARDHILSCPLVISPSLEDLEDGGVAEAATSPTLLGWCDIGDILRGLLQHIKKDNNNSIPPNMLLLMTGLEAASRPFGDRTLVTLAGGEDKSLVYETEADAPLLSIINTHLLNNGGIPGKVVHRLAVFDAAGDIQHVVSQLDIIRLLASSPEDLLGSASGRSLADLGLLPSGPAHVVCVDPHIPTLIALDRMVEAGVSGAAVVSAAGQLVANLSTSDLRGIQPEHLGVLALPVAEFLALLHGTSYLGFSQRSSDQGAHPFFAAHRGLAGGPDSVDAVRLITCRPSSTLTEVLKLMSDNHVHRVYVVDPDAKPEVVAVVTPTDVLRWLVDPSTPRAGSTPRAVLSAQAPGSPTFKSL